MSGSRRIGPGDVAPDFAIAGTDGTPEGHRSYSLSEFRGRPVVLAGVWELGSAWIEDELIAGTEEAAEKAAEAAAARAGAATVDVESAKAS